MTDGPAAEMVLPEPMNRPVPMAPPMAISWMCRLVSCRSKCGSWWVVTGLVLTCCSSNHRWLKCCGSGCLLRSGWDRAKAVEAVKVDAGDAAGLAFEAGDQAVRRVAVAAEEFEGQRALAAEEFQGASDADLRAECHQLGPGHGP